ncbi:hypothetical protein EU528_13185 [Candidatus Thorarchaeota archaeon]|nr:MAG: hypothetical protein EU528_13185 [Candidatus Thorarchaeota archaeon]
MREISTISPTMMVSLWWTVRWVRGLVLMLIPIGVVDAIFTIGMSIEYGPAIEFNPITRWFLINGLWHIWAIINILAYTFFCMLAGSYYLHTRDHPSGPDTLWLSLIISLRIAMTAFNVTFFYLPFVVSVYPPFWVGLIALIGSLYLTNNLFKRQRDLTWRDATSFISSRLDNRYDTKLIMTATAGITQNEDMENKSTTTRSETDTSGVQEVGSMKRLIWIKRLAYFAGFVLSYVGMAVCINIIAVLSDFTRWQSDIPTFNPFTGLIFMESFVVILFFTGLSMYFLFKSFTILSEDEIPV